MTCGDLVRLRRWPEAILEWIRGRRALDATRTLCESLGEAEPRKS
jgi:hypothetical protein